LVNPVSGALVARPRRRVEIVMRIGAKIAGFENACAVGLEAVDPNSVERRRWDRLGEKDDERALTLRRDGGLGGPSEKDPRV